MTKAHNKSTNKTHKKYYKWKSNIFKRYKNKMQNINQYNNSI